MGQEIIFTVEAVASWKQILLAVAGFLVRILWFWEYPIQWPRVIAGIIFMLGTLYLNRIWVSDDWRDVTALLIGLFTNNIIKGLFRWWKVNEDGLMDKTKKWWDSDRH